MDEFLELPQAAVMRVVKSAIDDGTIVSKEAKIAFCRAARVFIQYLTACCNDYSKGLGRSTMNAGHVLGALEELEFKDFAERLTKVMEDLVLAKKTGRPAKHDGDGEEDDQPKDDELEVDD